MAVGVMFDFPGVSASQYEEACRRLNNGNLMRSLSDWPNGGVLSHVAGPTPNGWRVVDVWESEDELGRFAETLMPILKENGFPDAQPQIFQIHNFVNR